MTVVLNYISTKRYIELTVAHNSQLTVPLHSISVFFKSGQESALLIVDLHAPKC